MPVDPVTTQVSRPTKADGQTPLTPAPTSQRPGPERSDHITLDRSNRRVRVLNDPNSHIFEGMVGKVYPNTYELAKAGLENLSTKGGAYQDTLSTDHSNERLAAGEAPETILISHGAVSGRHYRADRTLLRRLRQWFMRLFP